jgi:hypothetical protein
MAGEEAIDVHIAKSLENNTYGVDVKQIGF